jgi:hypothetical protein
MAKGQNFLLLQIHPRWRWDGVARMHQVQVGSYYFYVAPGEESAFIADLIQMRLFTGNQGRKGEHEREHEAAPANN